MVSKQQREEADARSQIAELRSALELDNDFPAWKRMVEGLMEAFYDRVSHWHEIPLKGRLRLVTAAVREVGRDAPVARIAAKAAELAVSERVAPPSGRRRR
jgi:hypothetical protein